MMSKKKLMKEVNTLEGKVEELESMGKVAVIATGATAIVGTIVNLIWNNKNTKSINLIGDFLVETSGIANTDVSDVEEESESITDDSDCPRCQC